MTTTSPSARSVTSVSSRRGDGPSATGRFAILSVVLLAMTLSLALPLREFVQQRARIAELTERTDTATAAVATLTSTRDRWGDPAYIAVQARQRLHYVMPGETPYFVLEPDPAVTSVDSAVSAATPRPWYSTLWGSVGSAAATPIPHVKSRGKPKPASVLTPHP